MFVFKEYRGRNIANLMISKVIETLREEGGTEVALGVRKANAAAIRAYEKCGFIREGVLQKEIYREGAYHDVVCMALFSEKA